MEIGGSVPHSQEPGLLSVFWKRSIQYKSPRSISWRHKYYVSIYTYDIQVASFPQTCPSKSFLCTSSVPIPAQRTAKLILLYLFTRIIFGEQYRSWSSSLSFRMSEVINYEAAVKTRWIHWLEPLRVIFESCQNRQWIKWDSIWCLLAKRSNFYNSYYFQSRIYACSVLQSVCITYINLQAPQFSFKF
jgi:hypothetical protein